jgi:predicted AAA+ superfamily ATPase
MSDTQDTQDINRDFLYETAIQARKALVQKFILSIKKEMVEAAKNGELFVRVKVKSCVDEIVEELSLLGLKSEFYIGQYGDKCLMITWDKFDEEKTENYKYLPAKN